MQHCESWFEGLGGIRLFYQSWSPDDLPQAVVVMVHGLGSHGGLFAPATDYLVAQGYAVYAFDLRGHGRSPGQRGHINAWAEFREDLRFFLKRITEKHPVCPCFLWGHSLGGTIALDYALRSPESLAGLVVTAPALNGVKVPWCKRWLGKLLSRILPQFSLRVGLKKHPGLPDPAMQLFYEQDPLRHEYGSARLATEFFATVDWIYHHAHELQVPLLILHGTADQVALPQASRAFFQRVLHPDREHREYPNVYHDLYLDLEAQLVLTDFHNWLERHREGLPSCREYALCTL